MCDSMFPKGIYFELVVDGKRIVLQSDLAEPEVLAKVYWATMPALERVGIDAERLRDLAEKSAELVKEGQRITGLQKKIGECLEKKELRELALRAFFIFFFSALGFPPVVREPIRQEAVEESERVVFVVNLPDWRVVKKAHPSAKTKPYEFGATLMSIQSSVARKLFGEQSVGKKRAIGEIVAFRPSSSEDVVRFLFRAGYPPVLDPQLLLKAYPDLKIPKPRGRRKL